MASILYVDGGDVSPAATQPDWQAVTETDLDAALLTLPVDVVVVGPATRGAVAAVQKAHGSHPDASVVVVLPPDDQQTRRALSYAPGMPTDLQVVAEPATDLPAVVALAEEQAARKRRHTRLMASLVAGMASDRPAATGSAAAVLAPLGTLLEHAPLGVLVADTAGRLISWNDRAATMLGINPDAGKPLAAQFQDPQPVADAMSTATSSFDSVPAIAVEVTNRSDSALELSAALTQLSDGTPAVLVLLLDVSARRAAEQARDELASRLQISRRSQAFLLQASDVLAQAAGYADTLQSLAAVAVPTLGDVCLIDVIDENGGLVRVAARHADPARQPLADELRRHASPGSGGNHPIALTVRDRQSRWSPAVDEEFLRATSSDERHFQVLRALGFSGYMTVPLIVDDRVLGSVTLISTGSGRRFHAEDLALAEELAGRVAAVVDKARRYDREHRLAESLQRAMQTKLPDLGPIQIAARYVPAREDTQVGGDWYDAFALPNDDIVLIVGDVVGHDLAAATHMGELRNLLRGLAFDRQESPADILARLDRLNDGLGVTEFATVLYAIVKQPAPGSYRLHWANAGHLPPVLALPDGSARFLDDNLDAALGLPADDGRREATVTLPAGSTLLLYTDGLVESRADQLDRGLPLLLRCSRELADQPLDQFCSSLLESIPASRDDDIALLALRMPT